MLLKDLVSNQSDLSVHEDDAIDMEVVRREISEVSMKSIVVLSISYYMITFDTSLITSVIRTLCYFCSSWKQEWRRCL